MNKFKIIFCGTPNISLQVLKALYENDNFEIKAVITQQDKPVGRYQKVSQNLVKKFCVEKDLFVLQPNKLSEIKEEASKLGADFLITCAYGKIIPESFLNLFKNCINFHASILPKYRGGSPVQYAIMNGEKETGISLMQMVKEMDAGQVYAVRKVEISLSDNNEDVFNKLIKVSQKIVDNELIDVLNGKIKGIQQDNTKVTFAYNLSKEQEQIDWSKSNIEIYNFIRALSPKPYPYTFLNNIRYQIIEASIENVDLNLKGKIGEILTINNMGMIVQTGDGLICLKVIKKESKNAMKTCYLKGNKSYLNQCFAII